MTSRWFLVLLAALLLIGPAAAITIEARDVSSYSVNAEPGYVIYQIIIDPINIGSNQTHVLNYNGAVFLLDIQTASSYGIWKDAWISLTLPNGTVQTAHTSATTIVGTYKTTIQPVFAQAQSGTVVFLDIDLMIGLAPASVQFSTQPLGWVPESAIPFSSASGTFAESTNVFVHELTEQEFDANVRNYNPYFGLTNLGTQVFQWTWNGVIGFIYQVPVIGPLFVTTLDMAGMIIGEIVYWLSWTIERMPAVILFLETMIMIFAVINAGKKPKIERVLKNLYNYNVMCLSGFLWLFDRVFTWTKEILALVASIINSLKPI